MVSNRGSTVTTYFDGDTRGLNRAVGRATRDLDGLGRSAGVSFGRLVGAISLANVATQTLAVGAGVLGSQLALARDGAKAYEEAQNRVNVVLGTSADQITEWARGSALAVGLSERAALSAAGTYSNLFIQLGLSGDKAAGMSKQMIQLAADLGSFHDADITDVLIAQQAAFRGEYDAIQRYVPTINAAAVQQQAMKMGLAASTKELSAQDKALATHQLIVEGAGDATGDWARTSDSATNAGRKLQAQIETLRDRVGLALVPAIADLTNETSMWIDTNGDEFAYDLAEGIVAVTDATRGVVEVFAEWAGWVSAIAGFIEQLQLPDWMQGNGGGAFGSPFRVSPELERANNERRRREMAPLFGGGEGEEGASDVSGIFRPVAGYSRPRGTATGRVGSGEVVPETEEKLKKLGKATDELAERWEEALEITAIRQLQLAHKQMEEAELAAAAGARILAEATEESARRMQAGIAHFDKLNAQGVTRYAPGTFETIAGAFGLNTNFAPSVDVAVP